MSCDYCFYSDEAKKRSMESYGFLSEETLKNIIRRTMLRAEGAVSYAFQGGEPTLRGLDFFRKVIEYEKKYNKNGIKVYNSLQTNGYLIDDEWCRFLRDNGFLVGLSVDGTGEIHDSLRHDRKTGGGTFERVLTAARLMDSFGVDYNILTVVTKPLAERIEEVYAFYGKRGWEYQQYIPCLDPLGEGHGNFPYSLTPEVYGDFLCRLFKLWYSDLKKGKKVYIRQFENWVGAAAGYIPEACDMCGHCGIQYVVEADGSVYPCDFYVLDHYRLGNFNENRLPELDGKRSELGFVERSTKISEECKSCPYYYLCRCGCQRNRDLSGGKYYNYFCESYKRFFGENYEKLMELGKRI